MFAIWVDTWLSGTPVAVRKMRDPRQQRGRCKSGTFERWRGGCEMSDHINFIKCESAIDILHLTCHLNAWHLLPLTAASGGLYINRASVIIIFKRQLENNV